MAVARRHPTLPHLPSQVGCVCVCVRVCSQCVCMCVCERERDRDRDRERERVLALRHPTPTHPPPPLRMSHIYIYVYIIYVYIINTYILVSAIYMHIGRCLLAILMQHSMPPHILVLLCRSRGSPANLWHQLPA